MSEQQEQQAPKRKLSLYNFISVMRFLPQFMHVRNDPKAFEQLIENLSQETGIPSKDIPIVRNAFIAVRDTGQDKQAYSIVDRYLVGGMGVVDLILLQVLLSAGIAGTLDTPLSIALILLVFSLAFTAMSLFFSFVKQQHQIPTYGRIHSNLSFLSLLTGTISLIAAFWHASLVDGIVFLCLAVVMYLWAGIYLFLVWASLRFISLQKPPEAEKPDAPDLPAS